MVKIQFILSSHSTHHFGYYSIFSSMISTKLNLLKLTYKYLRDIIAHNIWVRDIIAHAHKVVFNIFMSFPFTMQFSWIVDEFEHSELKVLLLIDWICFDCLHQRDFLRMWSLYSFQTLCLHLFKVFAKFSSFEFDQIFPIFYDLFYA